MEKLYEQSTLDVLVSSVFRIDDVTTGDPEKSYIVRYRGCLLTDDSEEAYERLTASLTPYNVTPLFRLEDDRQAVILVKGRPKPKQSNPAVNLLLFILTLLSVTLVGGLNELTGPLPPNLLDAIRQIISTGWPFAVSLMAILAAHEFGHYLVGRYHGVNLTLPYFIPIPMPPFGTMGAVINMKEPPRNRRHLLDIGLAGPLSGLVVAIPVLILGLSLSKIDPLPLTLQPGTAYMQEGNSLLYMGLKYLVFGQLLPTPLDFDGMPEWLYRLRFFFTGQPAPLGGIDVMLHPVALAGWAGILITALNLIPAGQFDGGHVIYVLLGRKRAAHLLPFVIVFIALLGIFWAGWWMWVALIFFLGRVYAEPMDQITPLDGRRRALAIFALIVFVLVFTPVPLNIIGG